MKHSYSSTRPPHAQAPPICRSSRLRVLQTVEVDETEAAGERTWWSAGWVQPEPRPKAEASAVPLEPVAEA